MPTRHASPPATLVGRPCFPACLDGAGPNSEADPGGNLYWVQELACNATAAGGSHVEGCPMAIKTRGRWVVAEDLANAGRVWAVDRTVNVMVYVTQDRQAQGKPRYFFVHRGGPAWTLVTDTGQVEDGSGSIAAELGLTSVPCIYWEKGAAGAWSLRKEIRPYYKFPSVLTGASLKEIAWECNTPGYEPPGGTPLRTAYTDLSPMAASLSLYGYLKLAFVLEDFDTGSLAWGSEPSLSSEVNVQYLSAVAGCVSDKLYTASASSAVPLMWPRFGSPFGKLFGPSGLADDAALYGCRLRWAMTKASCPAAPTAGHAFSAIYSAVNFRCLVYA